MLVTSIPHPQPPQRLLLLLLLRGNEVPDKREGLDRSLPEPPARAQRQHGRLRAPALLLKSKTVPWELRGQASCHLVLPGGVLQVLELSRTRSLAVLWSSTRRQ